MIDSTVDPVPIPMILHCPRCGLQHIDAADPEGTYPQEFGGRNGRWTNPPHKSHLCRPEDGGCGHIWRPADVPTNGVAELHTRGRDDSSPVPRRALPPSYANTALQKTAPDCVHVAWNGHGDAMVMERASLDAVTYHKAPAARAHRS